MPHTTTVSDGPRSVQAEQLLETARRQWADLVTVDNYYREHEGTGVDICRQRGGRHRFPPLPQRAPFERNYSPSGYLIRYTEPCEDCGLAYQVQRFEPYETKDGRKTIIRFRKAYSTTSYLTGPNGERYTLPPGHGFIRPRDYLDAAATAAVHADPDAQAVALAALKHRTAVLARREADQ